MNLADLLRAEGVTVHEVDGWQHRHRAGEFTPAGILFHHTAGLHALTVVVNGRADLAGPLANVYLDKQGVAHVVAAGRCNHAGKGAGIVAARIRNDKPPLGPAAKLGLVDDTDGNRWFYGVEMENMGDGADPWPAVQLDAAARIGSALCREHGWTANRLAGHLEWTRRKIDPRGFPMSSLRALAAERLTQRTPQDQEDDDMWTPEQQREIDEIKKQATEANNRASNFERWLPKIAAALNIPFAELDK